MNEEAREAQLIERVKAIYEAQGIEVPDTVIREGVEALKRDRFTYRAPERTLAVKLAEIYVSRRRWMPWVLAGLIGTASLLGYRTCSRMEQHQQRVEAYEQAVDDVRAARTDAEARLERAEQRLITLRALGERDDAPRAFPSLVADAQATLDDARGAWRRLGDSLEADAVEGDSLADNETLGQAQLKGLQGDADVVATRVGRLEGQLSSLERLGTLGGEMGRLLDALDSAQLSAAARDEVARLSQEAKQAIDAGDASRAKDLVGALGARLGAAQEKQALAEAIAKGLESAKGRLAGIRLSSAAEAAIDPLRQRVQAALGQDQPEAAAAPLRDLLWMATRAQQRYRLRIVQRPRTGLWRAATAAPGGRNYYILVEPVASDGRVLAIDVRNEENGKTERVRQFGVRVPKAVFDQISADKRDNGIVDRDVFGEKRQGDLEPTYQYPVAGGWITAWR